MLWSAHVVCVGFPQRVDAATKEAIQPIAPDNQINECTKTIGNSITVTATIEQVNPNAHINLNPIAHTDQWA